LLQLLKFKKNITPQKLESQPLSFADKNPLHIYLKEECAHKPQKACYGNINTSTAKHVHGQTGVALLYMFISNGVKRVHVIDNMHLTKYLNISNPEDI